jgi:hypothetical protein
MQSRPIPRPFRSSFYAALLLAFALLLLESCKSKKQAQQQEPQTGNCHLDLRLPKPLISDMRKNEFRFEWLSGKLSCEASDDSSKFEFDVTLRMRRDSAIWMMVTGPLNLKVARVLITKDSVKFIQYLPEEKCFQGDFIFLSQLLQTDVDFDMMQSLLVGNSASFYEEDEKLKASINKSDCSYTLSTIRKRKLKKVLEGDRQLADPLQTISLDPSTFKIMRILFLDMQNRTFTASYDDFAPEDSMLFPHHAVFYAKGLQKTAKLDVTYKRLTLNEPLEFPFNFPDDCQPIIIPQQPEPPQQPGNGR